MNTTFKPEKNTGIELLRIIAMLWIIMFHYADHGMTDMTNAPLSVNWIILAFARMGGGIGNCLFVLITGYLLYNKKFTLKRIVKLWMEVWCYSVIIGTICYAAKITDFSFKGLLKMVMPVLCTEYWYMSVYVMLYFLIPFINKMIACINKKQHSYLIIIMLFFFSVLPTFAGRKWLSGIYNFPIFIMLYLIGAYIKKYDIKKFSRKEIIMMIIISGIFIWLSEIIFKIININPFYFVWEMNKSSVIFISVFFFLLFVNWNPKLPKFILNMASSIFGVYLIHIGRLNIWIFREVFDNSSAFYNWYMIIQLFAAVFLIFIFSILIDKVRYLYIEKPLMKKLDKLINKWDEYLSRFLP